jgi:hypothetical protein
MVRTAARRSALSNAYQLSAWPRCVGRRPIQELDTKKPAADFVPRGCCELFDDATMPVFCPTGQPRFLF